MSDCYSEISASESDLEEEQDGDSGEEQDGDSGEEQDGDSREIIGKDGYMWSRFFTMGSN